MPMIADLAEAKAYLRVDGDEEDTLIDELLRAAQKLCEDVSRLDETHYDNAGGTARAAVLYTLAYLYEHREEADHHALVLTLRNLLVGVREEGF